MPNTIEEHKRQLDNALMTIQALEIKIDEMAARYEEEIELIEQQGLVRSQVEINALRDALVAEAQLSEKYRRELNEALKSYTSSTNHLRDLLSEDKVKYEALLQIVEGIELERKEEEKIYSEKLDKINLMIKQSQQFYMNYIIRKIEFTSRESLLLVKHIDNMTVEKARLLKK